MLPATLPSGQARGRVVLVLIFVAFFAPILAAWWLVGEWRPAGTVHHGRLLDPAVSVTYLRGRTADGARLGPDWLQGYWTLVYVDDGACDSDCRDGLYAMRQVRLALGKESYRVRNLLLEPRLPAGELGDWLTREHPQLTAAVTDTETRAVLERPFGDGERGIYLIDPLGNLLMRYRVGDDPRGILKDLTRLLKLSKIG